MLKSLQGLVDVSSACYAFYVLVFGMVTLGLLGFAKIRTVSEKGEEKELKVLTINAGAYPVPTGRIDRRSESIVAKRDIHIVVIDHFIGVGKGGWSDNGHILSKNSNNS